MAKKKTTKKVVKKATTKKIKKKAPVKKVTKKAPIKKVATKKAPVKKRSAVKKVVDKVKDLFTGTQDYGRPPSEVGQYEPILDFNPNRPPENYIIVRMGHTELDDMLIALTRKKADKIGIPCRKVR